MTGYTLLTLIVFLVGGLLAFMGLSPIVTAVGMAGMLLILADWRTIILVTLLVIMCLIAVTRDLTR